MKKQDAITLLGVTEKTFQTLVSEKAIRRTHLRNGHYSYNEDDIRKLANITTKKKVSEITIRELEHIDDLLLHLQSDKIIIKTSNRFVYEIINLFKTKEIEIIKD